MARVDLHPQDILEGGNLRVPLQELHQMILTPIKAYCSPSASPDEHSRDPDPHHPPSLIGSDGQVSDGKDSASGGMQQHHLPGCEGESGGAPLPEGDLPGQFTRVMGKGKSLRVSLFLLVRLGFIAVTSLLPIHPTATLGDVMGSLALGTVQT